MAFVKISIIVFLKRLLGSVRLYAIISNCLIAFIAVWALTAVLVNTFQCTPVQYYYDKSLNGHCMKGQVQFFQAMGSIALVEDVFILCLPIPIVWGLQITLRQKMALTVVFSLGGLYVSPARICRASLTIQGLHLQSHAPDRIPPLRRHRSCVYVSPRSISWQSPLTLPSLQRQRIHLDLPRTRRRHHLRLPPTPQTPRARLPRQSQKRCLERLLAAFGRVQTSLSRVQDKQ